ncbi:MAG: hypothetical protein ACI8T1_001571 [Verrucomicrobiales bacterium]
MAKNDRIWSWLICGVLIAAAIFIALRNSEKRQQTTEMIPVVPRRSFPFALSKTTSTNGASPITQTEESTQPIHEAWPSEHLASQANARFKRLKNWLVQRDSSKTPSDWPDAFLETLTDGISDSLSIRASFKIVRLQEVTASRFEMTVQAELAYPMDSPTHQRNSRWHCTWNVEGDRTLWVVSAERVFQEEVSASHATPRFEDVTGSVLVDHSSQHTVGIDAWSQRLTRIDEMTLQGHHGLAVGDVNGDGLDDLYVCDGGGLPNRLYLQKADGTLDDVSSESKTDWLESSSAALLVDLDNDGDQDLVVATIPLILFSENIGSGRFQFRGGHEAVSSAYTLAAADFDSDGDLDVYATNYSGRAGEKMGSRGFEAQAPMPFHNANNGGRNALLENRGNFQFVDATERVGLDENNRRFSFSAAWEDADNDGDQDLYVANDFGRNNLYQNNNGHFKDVAAAMNVEDTGAGMSVDWADCNHDGRMDVYVGNMFSAAGNRVTFQEQFIGQREAGVVADVQRMARGNSLFLGSEEGGFRDVSIEAGVSIGQWAWSAAFVDFNNDGWQDLIVANGYLTNRRADDL